MVADERDDAGPELLLAFVGEALQILDLDAGHRARQQLHVADHAHAVGAVRLAAAAHRQPLLGVRQIAFELAPLIHQLSKPLRHLFKRHFKLRRRRLGELRQVMGGLARGHAGQRLDAAHAGGHAAVGQSEDQADVAGALDVGAAAQFDRPAHGVAAGTVGFWPIATTRTSSPYFSPNSARAPEARASSSAIRRVVTGEFCSTIVVGDVLDLLDLLGRHRLGMREVEPQPVGRHQRALLRDVIAEHLAQRLVQQMRRRMVLADGAAAGVIDIERQGGRRP